MLKVNNLSFKINSKKLLNDISFEVQASEILCILGPNGAGKTTLIKCLSGLIQANHGEILINDKNQQAFSKEEFARNCAYVPQKLSSIPPFKTEEFINQSSYAWTQQYQNMDDIIDLCEINQFRDQTLNTLSGGELQRTLFAAALHQNTPLILLDEVTAGLDPAHHDSICKLIKYFSVNQNKTFVWVTHDLNAALNFADKILILKNGARFHSGTPVDHHDGEILSKAFDKKFKVLNDVDNNTFLF